MTALQEDQLNDGAAGDRAGEQPVAGVAGTGREPRALRHGERLTWVIGGPEAGLVTPATGGPDRDITPVMGGPGPLDVPPVLGTSWCNVADDNAKTLSRGWRDVH
jgi:hypothetical protein